MIEFYSGGMLFLMKSFFDGGFFKTKFSLSFSLLISSKTLFRFVSGHNFNTLKLSALETRVST